MQIPLQINVRGITQTPELDAQIRERAKRLEHFHGRITRCQVVVEAASARQRQGREVAIRVELHIPGRVPIVASRKHDEDIRVALRDAFDAVTRQLEDDIRERRDASQAGE